MRRWRWLLLTVVAALELVMPVSLFADVTDYIGKPVVAVRMASEGRPIVDERLSTLLDTRVGRPLAMIDVRESIRHLFSLAVYEDVQVRAQLEERGVSLTYDLVPLHPVASIEFTGSSPGIDADTLLAELTQQFGNSPRAGRSAEMADAVQRSLRDAGYLRARVTPRTRVQHDPDRTILTFEMQPGPRATVGTIDVEGDSGLAPAQLRARLALTRGEPYERIRINNRIESYLADRRRSGHYQARLSVVSSPVDDDRTVNLRVVADQGPRVRLVFAGDPVPADRRDELVPIAREGSADEDLLEDSSNRIEAFFREQGYRDVQVPHTREERDGELVITFTVRRGGQYRVDSIALSGNSTVASEELTPRLRIRAGQPFSSGAVDADVIVLQSIYRQRGFSAVRVTPVLNPLPPAPDGHVPVAIQLQIVENAQTRVNSLQVTGNQHVPEQDLLALVRLAPGQPFSQAQLSLDRDAIELHYANLGYQNVAVESAPTLTTDNRQADVTFIVREGPQVIVDHVLIVGNHRTKTATIERELRFKEGEPLGLEAVSESQRRLATLGLFRRTRITQLGRGDELTRDVLVTVEEAPLTTLGYGGGFEVRPAVVRSEADPTVASEVLEFAPRASFEIGRRNLFGTNRSVNLFTSASLHPRNTFTIADSTTPVGTEGTTSYGFFQYRVLGQFRQPRVFGTAADFRVATTLDQQRRSSFDFSRRSASADIAVRLPHRMSLSGGYQIQRTRAFNQRIEAAQQRAIDRLFPKVRLSSVLASLIRDTRNDPIDPTGGAYLSANGQLAARKIGSEVGFAKSFFTAQTFRTLPGSRGIVFAASARVGAASTFGNSTGAADLPASERFFAGGDTTVRGFALDRLGIRSTPAQASDTLDDAGFPLGGNALALMNAELRVPTGRSIKVVGFADVGNVFKTVSDVSFSQLRPALGFGLRYKSPVGPLRFDLGFKTPRHAGETRAEWFITFGEAF